MDDYVEVAERIRLFKEKYPEGSLQSDEALKTWTFDDQAFIAVRAYAYRTPDDPRPGVGWAWEPVPGRTPFTKDSELMNAETSAWGRAIVALGFETKKIASANEVRNRQASSERDGNESALAASPPRSEGSSDFKAPPSAAEKPATKGTLKLLKDHVESLQKGFPSPDKNHKYWDDVQNFAYQLTGKTESAEWTELEAQQVVREFENRLLKAQHADLTPIA
jgi:hypothetical protein